MKFTNTTPLTDNQLLSTQGSVKSFHSKGTTKKETINNFIQSSRSDTNSIKTELLADNQVKASTESQNLDSALDCSTKSKTIDNLFETLKELEKVEKFPSPPQSSNNLYESNDTLIEDEKCKKNRQNIYFENTRSNNLKNKFTKF